MNRRILIKYDENLYSDSGLIRENRTLWFCSLEHFQNAITSSFELQIRCSIYPFWLSRWVLHHGGFKSLVWVHLILVLRASLFLPWIQPNCLRNICITWKTWLHDQTCEIYKVGIHLDILTILSLKKPDVPVWQTWHFGFSQNVKFGRQNMD
jgi:hypothetical protein